MKIGILTLPLETNYGGNLQAFALQKIVKEMGHEVITVDRHRRKQYSSFFEHFVIYLRRLYLKHIRNKKISTKWNPFLSEKEYEEVSSLIQPFIHNNINLTRRIYLEQIQEIDEEYKFDAYIVGSDQVWLDQYCPSSFLDFVKRKDVIKIAYAASAGKRSFFNNHSKTNVCKKLAKDFDGISVREDYLVDMCEKKLNIKASFVLDPTMLLDPNDYLSITSNNVGCTPIIFSYILDSSVHKDRILDFVAKQMNISIVAGNRNGSSKIFPSVDDWIYNIDRSKYVITDSFHGTAFAILFNKPFITIGNKNRGIQRFVSLLKIFNLQDRLIFEDSAYDIESLINKPINYKEVNDILEKQRKLSVSFILNLLDSKKGVF